MKQSCRTALAFAPAGTEELTTRIRRLNLCADFVGFSVAPDELEHFVSRSKKRGEYRARTYRDEASIVTGYTFSEGGPIMARIYDKTRELAKHGNDSERVRTETAAWWAGGWDGVAPVWRVEFQARREALESLGVFETRDLTATNLAGMWRYFTEVWLRLVNPTTDARRSRCETDGRWAIVQDSAPWGFASEPLRRQSGARGGATVAQAAGTMLSVLAASGDLEIRVRRLRASEDRCGSPRSPPACGERCPRRGRIRPFLDRAGSSCRRGTRRAAGPARRALPRDPSAALDR